jgi:blocked-early-in-transport protein 1
MNRMISKRHQRQLCFYVSVLVFLFFIIYYGAPFAKGLFNSNDPSTSLPDNDTTITKPNIDDM